MRANSNISSLMGMAPRQSVVPSSELIDSTRNVGIEIEIENVDRSMVARELGDIWCTTGDGSLRPANRSVEILFPVPGYCGAKIIEALDALALSPTLQAGRYGWRTATHAHIDMRDKTLEDIHMLTVFYALLEPFIFAWDGKGRHESRFCMPWWVCSKDMFIATDLSTSSTATESRQARQARLAVSQFSKYTALNLAPLSTIGTVEFRHMQSTIDRARLLTYINLCLDIVGISDRAMDRTPIDLVMQYLEEGPDPFIRSWLSAPSAEALLHSRVGEVPLTTSILDRSVHAAISLAESASVARPFTSPHITAGDLQLVFTGESS